MSEEDIKILEEQWGDTDNLINDLICDYKELQSKIDKAIEYIKENRDGTYCDSMNAEYLLKILRGEEILGDKE